MSEESDIEMKSALPKKTKKIPKSPTAEMLKEPKKITTKEMVNEALLELRSRKGTSLFAIKKYIELKYNVDVEKIKHIIKKYLVASVEDGTIIQTKGIGASGSFKLVASKEKSKKKQKPEKKIKKKNPEGKEAEKKNTEKKEKKEKKERPKLKKAESNTKGEKLKKNEPESKTDKKEIKKKTMKPKKKIEKGAQTPAKKRAAMMKRKSIGTIIKPPKMKPTAKRAAI